MSVTTSGAVIHAVPTATEPADERRRVLRSYRATDVYAVAGSLAASVATTTLLFTRLTPFSGVLGFVVVALLLFVGSYALLISFDEPGPVVRDRVAAVTVHVAGALIVAALGGVIGYTIWRGRSALAHLNFFTSDMADAGPLQPLSVGGITHAITGTLIQISIALAVVVPLGLLCAVFLNEVSGPFSRFVRTVVEAMTALPSIICGLFIYATLILSWGVEKSGLAAGLALSVEMLPITIRAADVVLRLVPGTLREASYALGSPAWRTSWHVLLPTARSGLTTAVILGTARGIGEAAPVLITAGFTTRLNSDPLHGPMNSLPLATLYFVKSPAPTMVARGFGTAAFLMLLVLVLFTLARIVGGRGAGQQSRRQQRAARRWSQRDATRFARHTAAATAVPSPEMAQHTPDHGGS